MAARAAHVVVVVFAAATLAFVTLQLAPGDAASVLSEGVSEDARAQLRVSYGYDQPMWVQYTRWLRHVATGDLGHSRLRTRPVAIVVWDALQATLWLAIPAFTLSLAIGMRVGRWQALHAGRRRERAAGALLLTCYSMPEFWFGATLLLLFAHVWPVLPAGGMTGDFAAYLSLGARMLDRLRHLVLPVVTMTVIGVATFARYQRESLVRVLSEPFVRAATGAGLPRSRVVWGAWRASLLPVVTVAGFALPAYVAGVVFVESVFSWPGVGRLVVDAVRARDVPLVCGAVIVGSAITAIAAAVADVVRERVDPRLA